MEANPILAAAKRVPAQMALGGADLLNLIAGALIGKGLQGALSKPPSEIVNQDVFGLPEPELLSTQGAAEFAAGFLNPAKLIKGGAAGIVAGEKYAKNLDLQHIMEMAKEMFSKGISNHKISQKTAKELKEIRNPGQAVSVFIGPDSLPRLVVGNDFSKVAAGKQAVYADAVFPSIGPEGVLLSDILLHPSLYQGSDLAKATKVKVNENLSPGVANYYPANNTIELARKFSIQKDLLNDPAEMLARVLRHEAGHVLQKEEGHRLGTGVTTKAQLFSVNEALAKGSFSSRDKLLNLQKELKVDLPLDDLMDMLKENKRLKTYLGNYGEWEAEFGAKMNPSAFPLMHERGKTW